MASIKIALIVIARILNNAIAITDFLRDDNHCQPAGNYFFLILHKNYEKNLIAKAAVSGEL
jgi:hypothetical protein